MQKRKLKVLSLVVGLLFHAGTAISTVRTLSNSPSGGAQFNSIYAAIAASSNGDTILVEGSNVPYNISPCANSNTLIKALTFIGSGFNPNKDFPKITKFSGATGCTGANGIGLFNGSSGSRFYGIQFTDYIISYTSLTNIEFHDCIFNQYFNFNSYDGVGISFTNCIFDSDNGVNVIFSQFSAAQQQSGILFNSCVFDGFIEGNTGNSMGNVDLDHCLFLATSTEPFHNVKNTNIQNSIFMNCASVALNSSANAMNNNLARFNVTIPPASNTGSNNIVATDPLFLNYTLNSMYSNSHNYNLTSGSAAIGAGTAGSNIGPHGSLSNFSESGEVLINPIIRSLLINNISVPPNGNLNVKVKATKPKTN